jgi:hypothetical protein
MNNVDNALQKLTKWRSVFAGWQLGTRSIEDAECQAVRDHREVTMLMRAELNALTWLLIDKKIFTPEEFTERVGIEAGLLDKDYEEKFPGISTSLVGVHYKMPEAAITMKGWRP